MALAMSLADAIMSSAAVAAISFACYRWQVAFSMDHA
jgi:hypothetical protein